MLSLNQPRQTMIARDFPINLEVSLMFNVMYLHQLTQTKVARDFSHNVEVTWMVRVMSLHP